MMINERRAFGRPIILTIVTALCLFCSAAIGQTEQKVRSGEASSIRCELQPQGVTYRWTLNDVQVRSNFTGIDSETIQSNRMRINRMTQLLAGTYRCYLDGRNELLNTIELFIVGIAEYSICESRSCSINHTYSPTAKHFTLDATIVFMNSGTECCDENLSSSVWTVKPNPGTADGSHEISRNNSNSFFPPGIDISVQTSNDLTSNIAMVNITTATTMFQIVHEIHTDVDGENGGQLALTFNFNYTKGSPTPTPSSSSILSSSSSVITTTVLPSPSVTSEISTSSSSVTLGNTPTSAVTTTTSTQPPDNTSESSVIATPTSGAGLVTQDEGSNTGIIVGVIIVIIVLAIVGAVVATAVVWWYRRRDNNRTEVDGAREPSTSANNRPTTLSYCERPLLNAINTYTSTATATPLNGAYGLHEDPANHESKHQNNGEEVQDGDINFDDDNADSGSVTVQF